MANVSIYNNIRIPKVTTGNAPIFASTRFWDEDAQICPVRSNVSDFGTIGVARDTIQTLAPGCHSALNRILVENAVSRPRYGVYLNVSQGLEGGDSAQVVVPREEEKKYDTMLGYQYVRSTLPRSQMVKTTSIMKTGNVEKDDAKKMNCIMSRVYNQKDCNPFQ